MAFGEDEKFEALALLGLLLGQPLRNHLLLVAANAAIVWVLVVIFEDAFLAEGLFDAEAALRRIIVLVVMDLEADLLVNLHVFAVLPPDHALLQLFDILGLDSEHLGLVVQQEAPESIALFVALREYFEAFIVLLLHLVFEVFKVR